MRAQALWDAYTRAEEAMFVRTHTEAPWVWVDANDKRRARVEVMRHLLHLDYPGRAPDLPRPDPAVVRPPEPGDAP